MSDFPLGDYANGRLTNGDFSAAYFAERTGRTWSDEEREVLLAASETFGDGGWPGGHMGVLLKAALESVGFRDG